MAEIILHHNGRYNFYDTIMDGIRFESSISLEQLTELIRLEYGEQGIDTLPERLERAHAFGHSEPGGSSLDEFLSINRVGENEEQLTTEEIIKRFLS